MKRRKSAFTLIELLVVVAIIGVLAALLLPALASAKKRAAQAHCLNNQKQLAGAMLMYLNDHDGAFPGWASKLAGFHPEDWIYWRTNSALYPSYDQSPILRTLGTVHQEMLRCPLDRSDDDRIAQFGSDPNGPYFFSYSLTGYGMYGTTNFGMSSVLQGPPDSSETSVLFKQSRIRNTSGKIMFAEEPGTLRPDDNPAGTFTIQDGRWLPGDDPLTKRHNGRAVVSFADGHAEAVKFQFGDDQGNSRPDL